MVCSVSSVSSLLLLENRNMARVVCARCGMTGHSKCPYCRTVFADNERNSVLQQLMTITRGSWMDKRFVDENGKDLVVTLNWSIGDIANHVCHLRDILSSLDDDGIRRLCCHHDWMFVEGERSSIGCGCV